jgi:hypothetical protein
MRLHVRKSFFTCMSANVSPPGGRQRVAAAVAAYGIDALCAALLSDRVVQDQAMLIIR